jgi:hypothetical protein
MSQVSSNGDLSVANQGFPAFRGDLNEILEAIYTCQSGTSTPTNNYANSFFYDQTNNLLKFRNEDNDAYITIMGFDQSADTTTNIVSDATQTFTKAQIPSTETATISTSKTLDLDTNQNFILTLGSGANTLANPTTEASNVGQTGVMIFIQPSSGSAGTVSLGTDYETVGGSGLTLSSTNSAYDVVPYIIKADNSILLGTPQLAFS